jgi:hypothetical protein
MTYVATCPMRASLWCGPRTGETTRRGRQCLQHLAGRGILTRGFWLRQAGFGECMDTEATSRHWLLVLQERRYLPPPA